MEGCFAEYCQHVYTIVSAKRLDTGSDRGGCGWRERTGSGCSVCMPLLQEACIAADVLQKNLQNNDKLGFVLCEQEFPACVRALSQLRILNLEDNNLAAVPEWIEEVKSLHLLDVSGNELTALPPQVSRKGCGVWFWDWRDGLSGGADGFGCSLDG